MRRWIAEEDVPWAMVRAKLRFVGITVRTKTSPNTWRWYQAAPWTAHLPRSALIGISLDGGVWGYLGDQQSKIVMSFSVALWLDQDTTRPPDGPSTGH